MTEIERSPFLPPLMAPFTLAPSLIVKQGSFSDGGWRVGVRVIVWCRVCTGHKDASLGKPWAI